MANHVGAIDQGTTSTRFMIFDHDGHEVARHELRHEQITPEEGWVEHDPHELWEATQDVIEAALGRAGIGADGLAAIGVTNQRETTVVWDRRTGEPYCHAIARHDVRIGTAGSGGGLGWILQHVDGVRADADAGHAIFGTIDSWLIWWLTGGPDGGRHMTDVTNAGRTALMDLGTLAWDDELLAVLGIPRSMLPEIRSSSEVYGRTDADGPFKGEVDVAAALGDQHAALVGQVCFRPGELAGTDGTDHAVIVNTGTEIVRSTHGLLTTPAYRFGDAPPVYALVGSTDDEALEDVVAAMIADSGTDLQILRDGGALAADEALMQRRADVLGVPVSRPVVAETTALGAAYAAGLAVGFWGSTDELIASWHESRRWEPASARESLG